MKCNQSKMKEIRQPQDISSFACNSPPGLTTQITIRGDDKELRNRRGISKGEKTKERRTIVVKKRKGE